MPPLRTMTLTSLLLMLASCCSETPGEDITTLHEQTAIPGDSTDSGTRGQESDMAGSTPEISLASPGITSCTLSVRDDLAPFVATLYWVGPPETPEGFRMAHTMTVSSPGLGEAEFSQLEACYHSASEPDGYLVVEDMNFDGYRDIRLMRSPTAGPNTYWYLWLFDPGKGSFERALQWEALELVSPSFDPEQRMITSFHRDGMGIYGTEFYEVRDGVPVLVRAQSTQYESEDSSVTTVMELVEGEMVVVEKRFESID